MSIYRGRNTTEFYLASVLYDSIEDLNIRAVISLITEKKADANIVLPRQGISPFHLAIGSENPDFALEITSLILQYGGDPNVRSDEGLTPLHIAAAWGRLEMVMLLLQCGADPDVQDNCYQTPADYAFEEQYDEIVKCIREFVNQDAISYQIGPKGDLFYNLDKVLISNGHAVGEYEVVKREVEAPTIDLKVLPQTNPNDYVMNWCNTLETQLENMALDDLSPKNFSHGSLDTISAPLRYQNVQISRGKIPSPEADNVISFEPFQEFKFYEKYRESGIQTLVDSAIEDDEPKTPPRKISVAKSKDTSSDYFTATEVSENICDQNIYEISSSVSSNSDLNHALIASKDCLDVSTVSVSEVYRYMDPAEGVVLFEKRILPPKQNCNETENLTVSSKSSRLSSLPKSFDYDTDTLRKELTLVGFEPGPITKSTKRVYLRKLFNIKKNPVEIPIEKTDKKVYSTELQKTLRNQDWSSDLTPYRILEESVSRQFSNPDPTRRWREGVNKSSFTYLLLDPRVTQNLPCRDNLSVQEQWETFLSSIFYVGKGKRSRPYQHLYEAISLHGKGGSTENKKLQHILNIWGEGNGVICLHLFQNVIPVEAYTREAAMISALKLENVRNAKSGDFYGVAATWNGQQKRMLGVYLLWKAMKIFLQEGERQLSPSDID